MIIKILAFLFSLTLLVMTHEMGHLLSAKAFGMRVRRFYVFFNWKFSILKIKKFDGKWHVLFFNATTPDEWEQKEPDNTVWGLGWIPLGGYCDIAGMIDETKTKDDLASEPQPWEYRSKPAWQRLIVISAGVVVNFLSALLLYTCIFAHWGKDELPLQNAKLGYEYCEMLKEQGFHDGDIILSIDGREMTDLTTAQRELLLEKPGVVTVKRTDPLEPSHVESHAVPQWRDTSYIVNIALTDDLLKLLDKKKADDLIRLRMPFVVKDFSPGSHAKRAGMAIGDSVVMVAGQRAESFTEISTLLHEHKGKSVEIGFFRDGQYQSLTMDIDKSGKMGVQLHTPTEVYEVVHTDYSFFAAIPAGIQYGCQQLVTYVKSLRGLFVKDGWQSLGGFGTLGSLFPSSWNWHQIWDITAMLAVILAFMNVIPIPGLDGGHILFTLWEIVTRRKPSDDFLNKAQIVGMVLLLLLLVVANGNDLLRILR
ncbi:MAG: site-2 protease family protein [Bacteroidales bacterium]|nr:site-2 protease family protein [Bacteroidales bacterium]